MLNDDLIAEIGLNPINTSPGSPKLLLQNEKQTKCD